MFSNAQQGGFISIFYSVGSNPLALWDKQVKNGHIRRIIDDEVKSFVLDIGGTNVATTYITCPIKPRASLGVRLPYLVMVIKNMKKYFSFEIQILDDKDMRRRFRVSNFQSTTKVRPFCTTMPIGLSAGWNQVQFNLADFTKRAYGSLYVEAVRVQIHANVRVRRIYFTDQLHSDEDLPNEFKLFAPGPREQKTKGKEKKASKEALEVPPLLKTEEEVPPPPSPAEQSPVAPKEEESPTIIPEEPPITAEAPEDEPQKELPQEAESPPAEGEEGKEAESAAGDMEHSVEAPGEEPAEPPLEPSAEGEAEPPAEAEAGPPAEAAADDAVPVQETEPSAEPEEGEPKLEEGEAQTEEAAEAVEAAPLEAPVDTDTEAEVVEVSTVVTTEVALTEVTETTEEEGSPSEPATETEGED